MLAEPIILGILSFLGVIGAAWLGYLAKVKTTETPHHPLLNSNMSISLRSFGMISGYVNNIFQNTSADRFLILAAHNGKNPLKYTSVFYEQHDTTRGDGAILSIGAISKYVKFEFDEEYRRILKQVENEGSIFLDVKKMAKGDLKSIYESERVLYSNIYFIDRIPNHDTKGNDLLLYCSVAKHKEPKFNDQENVVIKYNVGSIKDLLKNIF